MKAPQQVKLERVRLREGRVPGLRGYLGQEPLARPAPWREAQQPNQLELLIYHPEGQPKGCFVVVQGMHYAGAEDPRMDRFCRVLAAAGFEVHAPMLPSYLDLLLNPQIYEDLSIALEYSARRLPRGARPSLFSISFGSMPALEIAARLKELVDGVVLFGGYADLDAALKFCLDGVMWHEGRATRLKRDPLNAPVLFLNLLPFLELGNTEALERALREAVYRTWGRFQYKQPGARDLMSFELAQRVPQAQRGLFQLATGLIPELDGLSAGAWLDIGLTRGRAELHFARPDGALLRQERPVVLVHGRDDDVIPWGESVKLHQALKERVFTRLFLTGLFAHTGAEPVSLVQVGRELQGLFGMLNTLAHGGQLSRFGRG